MLGYDANASQPVGKHCKVCSGTAERDKLSEQNVLLEKHTPREFARNPRALDELDIWKATEFRLMVLYTGPCVLKNALPEHMYENFLVLHCAVYVLANKELWQEHADYAESLLRYFVTTFVHLYEAHQVSYNVHCLIRIAQDVKNTRVLDGFSAFPFENNMLS